MPAIAMASHAPLMATGDKAGVVRLWDIADPPAPKLIHRLSGHTETAIDADFSNDGRYLVAAGGDWDYTIKSHIAEICIWDVKTHELLVKLEGHSEGVWHCEFSPDSSMLATTSLDCRVKVWDVQELLDYGKAMRANPSDGVLAPTNIDLGTYEVFANGFGIPRCGTREEFDCLWSESLGDFRYIG